MKFGLPHTLLKSKNYCNRIKTKTEYVTVIKQKLYLIEKSSKT